MAIYTCHGVGIRSGSDTMRISSGNDIITLVAIPAGTGRISSRTSSSSSSGSRGTRCRHGRSSASRAVVDVRAVVTVVARGAGMEEALLAGR